MVLWKAAVWGFCINEGPYFLAAGVNTLLTLYGIPIRGTIAMKKKRFALFIGLILDIDF